MTDNRRILISVPNTGDICKHVVFSLLKLQMDFRFKSTIILPTHNPYENNLNHIVKDFIDGGYDFWLNIDSDNPPTKNPLDMVHADFDIMGFPTPQLYIDKDKEGDRPFYFVAVDAVEGGYKEHQPMEDVQEVDAIGSGCMLIARRVLLKMQQPFMRIYDDYGRVQLGADFNFCRRAKEAGWRIFANYNYPCMHIKRNVEMLELIKAFQAVKHG